MHPAGPAGGPQGHPAAGLLRAALVRDGPGVLPELIPARPALRGRRGDITRGTVVTLCYGWGSTLLTPPHMQVHSSKVLLYALLES